MSLKNNNQLVTYPWVA